MKGIDHLIAMRKAGKRPECVWINFDLRYIPPKSPSDLINLELGYSTSRDLRPFVALDVILFADTWRPEVGALFERLQEFARSITVFIVEFGADLGWWWSRERGRVEFIEGAA